MSNIEQEIRQKSPFRNPHHRAIVNLMYMASWIQNQIKDFLKPYKLTPQQYNVLRILRGAGGPISTYDIRERLLDKNSDASRLVDRMCRLELTEKTVSAHDRRRVDVTITNRGLLILDHIEENIDRMDQIVAALNPEQANLLSDLLDQVRQ